MTIDRAADRAPSEQGPDWEGAYVEAETELERAYGDLRRLQEAAGLVLDDAVPIDASRRSHVLDYSLDSLREALEESRESRREVRD